MSALPRARVVVARLDAWRKARLCKPLRQTPTAYLVIMTSASAFIVLVASSFLPQATITYIEKVLPASPWPVSLIVGLMLLPHLAMTGVAALMATTYGRALGEKLFDPART